MQRMDFLLASVLKVSILSKIFVSKKSLSLFVSFLKDFLKIKERSYFEVSISEG